MALKIEAALRKDRTNANSTMEHRHFATIAGILASIKKPYAPGCANGAMVDAVSRHFANELASTNPKFDRVRFLRACGVQS
jgi:hypothetical protein